MKKQNVRTLSFIVSTFTYLLIGAAIFDALESQTEENTRNNLTNSEKDYKHKFNITETDYKDFEDIVIKYHPYRTFPQWKFTGAFYFSLTVITTIGYGHSTPQTFLGKTFCMLYAIVGIPLCLVMFQSVGERLNYFSSFSIQLIKKCLRFKKSEVNQTESVFVAAAFALFAITGGAAIFSHYEGWTYFDSIYYCVITLTTIGFGDYVALQDKNNLSNISYVILSLTFILFGLTVVASSFNLLVFRFLTLNTDDERKEEYTKKVQQRLSNNDVLNVVNGDVLCTFEPHQLEELRRENSLNFCFLNRNSFRNIFNQKLSFFLCSKSDSSENNNQDNFNLNQNLNKNLNYDHDKLNNSHKLIRSESNLNCLNTEKYDSTTKNKLCSFCIHKPVGSKKSHYTIRRAPGKISHLLINQRNDIISINNNLINSKSCTDVNSKKLRTSQIFKNDETKIGSISVPNEKETSRKTTIQMSKESSILFMDDLNKKKVES